MSHALTEMLSLLSEEDRHRFIELSERLKQLNGDISQLSDDDLQLIKLMEGKYGDAINQTHKKQSDNSSVNNLAEESFLSTPFAHRVRQILARDLGHQYPLEENAVIFAFDNKWQPPECLDEGLINSFYSDFELDIIDANKWNKEMVEIQSDKKMAVGLAWFMVIYQLYQRVCN